VRRQESTQRDLHTRTDEILDAVQNGESFTIIRDGHPIGELIALGGRRRLEAFRADQDAAAERPSATMTRTKPLPLGRCLVTDINDAARE
jgi:antitoxin (DNA-binding transcriptional repressor) of toxin-antitoxin stability system